MSTQFTLLLSICSDLNRFSDEKLKAHSTPKYSDTRFSHSPNWTHQPLLNTKMVKRADKSTHELWMSHPKLARQCSRTQLATSLQKLSASMTFHKNPKNTSQLIRVKPTITSQLPTLELGAAKACTTKMIVCSTAQSTKTLDRQCTRMPGNMQKHTAAPIQLPETRHDLRIPYPKRPRPQLAQN